MKRLINFLLPLIVLLTGIAIAASLIASAPETERKSPPVPLPSVEVATLQPESYQVKILSRGTISPLTSSSLVPEVSGRIIEVAENFRNGGFFAKGELLLQIDPRDYQNAVTIARAELAIQKQALAEELARSEQARNDWQKLQLTGEPDPLVLRIPQLETAQAKLAAAEARLQQARLDLERTRISAPYAGRVLEKKVDFGQYVSAGSSLADIYASDCVEVRLPITSEQQLYLELPENGASQAGARVEFIARIGKHEERWPGRLVRTEGSVDIRSRQLFVVARIDDPYRRHGERAPLKIGQFLEAEIFGKTLEQVFIIPRHAVRGEQTIYLVDKENRLQRRELEVVWRDEQSLIARGPLQPGDRLSLTTLPFAANGIKVEIAAAKTAQPES
ncbi:efflux RND transporter periplasmic adaptor subunit [Malonomonas rubra]|uniref:efflux RND transporter periplasmic adaptor subunit n=1 Tax=Malonomonas rubra TaxID=57040 RepID=UPI0026F0B2D8|nr:efflux RND transporter periplasmic adaptor subunit [Malonomonas rubra]